jgi:hypothetical protein
MLLNAGTLNLTPLQKEQVSRSQQEMQQYWATEAPALSAALVDVNKGPSAYETKGQGADSASARDASAAGIGGLARASSGAQVNPGSGSFSAKLGESLARGASGIAGAGVAGTGAGLNAYTARVGNLAAAGQGVLRNSDSALGTAAAIQGAGFKQNTQDHAEDQEALSNLFTQIGGMGSMASGAGSMGGGGG